MKRVLAVTLLLMSFASVAFADGGGLPPKGTAPTKPIVVLLADGGGLPPKGTAPTKPIAVLLADGGGLPPVK